jgi:hypothetical protein
MHQRALQKSLEFDKRNWKRRYYEMSKAFIPFHFTIQYSVEETEIGWERQNEYSKAIFIAASIFPLL